MSCLFPMQFIEQTNEERINKKKKNGRVKTINRSSNTNNTLANPLKDPTKRENQL